MANPIRVSARELKVLVVLESHFTNEFDDWRAVYFRTIARESGIEPHLVRRVVRSLARKALARYERGLMNEDGGTAGAGYRCTQAGHDFLAAHLAAEESAQAPRVSPLPAHSSTEVYP